MSEHIEVSAVICHIWSDIVFLCIETSNVDNTYKRTNNNRLYRGLQFRLNVTRIIDIIYTRIRGFSPGTVHLERAYAKVLLCFRISAQSTSCSLRESSLTEHSFVETRYIYLPTEYATFKWNCNPR